MVAAPDNKAVDPSGGSGRDQSSSQRRDQFPTTAHLRELGDAPPRVRAVRPARYVGRRTPWAKATRLPSVVTT